MGKLASRSSKLGGSLRAMVRQLWNEHSSPQRLGAAVGVGILIGCSPFYGSHFFIGLGAALLLRLNKIAVQLGSQISIPPLAPLIAFSAVQLGSFTLTGRLTALGSADVAWDRLGELLGLFFLYWLVGGAILGVMLGLAGFALTTLWLQRRATERAKLGAPRPAAADRAAAQRAEQTVAPEAEGAPWTDLCRQITARYAEAPKSHQHYLSLKLRLDPVYRQIVGLSPAVERVVDLGTGLGQLPMLLILAGRATQVMGVDWDAQKLASGQRAAAGLSGLQLVQADARQVLLPTSGMILAIDLLHYFTPPEQQALLERAVAALAPGGLLVVRETERRRSAIFTRALETLAVRWGWNKGPTLSYRSRAEWRATIEALGLRYGEVPSSSLLHRGNVLFWGRRETRPPLPELPGQPTPGVSGRGGEQR